MNSAEIRETYLSYFEERGHRRMASASLVPPPEDTSTLLTVANFHYQQTYLSPSFFAHLDLLLLSLFFI